MDERENKIIEEYVSKMLEVQKEQFEKPLTLDELKEIAFSVGMSESDWQASQQAMQQHLSNGKAHLKNKNWQDAVSELKQAAAINPSVNRTATSSEPLLSDCVMAPVPPAYIVHERSMSWLENTSRSAASCQGRLKCSGTPPTRRLCFDFIAALISACALAKQPFGGKKY
jgi:hypothetical protein